MEEPLNKLIGVRVSTQFFNKLSTLMRDSNCQTIGEFARMILQKEEIIFYTKDASAEKAADELAAIRRELKSIGNNINQIVRYFHGAPTPDLKFFEMMKALAEYQVVSEKINLLFTIISELSSKWSQK